MNEKNERIIPPQMTRGMAISCGKFVAKIKRISGLDMSNWDEAEDKIVTPPPGTETK